jgi:hypothetical protein
MSASSQPSLHDSIIAFLRERPEGVSAAELGERFLKLKGSIAVSVAPAIKAMLLPDRRCFQDETGLWHARARQSVEDPAQGGLPFVAVHGVIDPVSHRVRYLSLWELMPRIACSASGWIVDPASLSFDDRDRLADGADAPFSPEAAQELLLFIASKEENRIPVFLGSTSRDSITIACSVIGETLPDDTLVVSELLRAAGVSVPRPLTLAALERAVPGAAGAKGDTARRQGEQFALCVAELLATLRLRGIETREDLDALFRREKASLFTGKEFSYDDLLALPASPAVYAFKDASDNYLYIGKAKNLRRRLLGYFGETDESPGKLEQIRDQSRRIISHQCGSELECLIHEYRLIRKYSPLLNRQFEVVESKGSFRPIDDCIVVLPHALPGRVMSVWVRREQRILLKSFDADPEARTEIIKELDAFFFSKKLSPVSSDFPEHQIAVRWIRRHADEPAIVPVHRMAGAEEVYEALRLLARDGL